MIVRTGVRAVAFLTAVSVTTLTMAQTAPSVAIVSEFEAACSAGELTLDARKTALAAAGWTAASADGVDVPAFAAVPAIDLNFTYSKPLTTERYTKQFEGQTITAILASFDPKRRYPGLCAVLVSGVRNVGVPVRYTDAFEAVAKSHGLKGKSVDLPHYFEYSGKLPDKRPARADIFSRSRVLGGSNDMHMTFAF